jgi:hypothetical protein
MECTIVDQGSYCQTGSGTDTESTSIVGYHYGIGCGVTTGPRLVGSIHMVDLYRTTNLPWYAQTRDGQWGDGDEFPQWSRWWISEDCICVRVKYLGRWCRHCVRVDAQLGTWPTMDKFIGIYLTKFNLCCSELLPTTV